MSSDLFRQKALAAREREQRAKTELQVRAFQALAESYELLGWFAEREDRLTSVLAPDADRGCGKGSSG